MKFFYNLDPKIAVVATRGANAFIQFLLIIFYGMYLSASDFGQLSILMIFIGLSYGLLDLGVNNTIITKKISKNQYGSMQVINLLIAITIGIFFYICSFFKIGFSSFGDEFYDSLAYFLPLLIIYSFTIVPYARLHKVLKLKQLALVDFIPVLSMLMTVPILLGYGLGIFTLFISVTIQVTLRFMVLKFFYGKIIRLNMKTKIPLITLSRQYISNLTVYLTSKLDQLIVAAFTSPSTLGLYSFLKQILNYPISLLIAIYTQITFPFFSKHRKQSKKIKILLNKSFLVLMLIITLYFIFLVSLPYNFMNSYISLWDLKTTLALLIMILSISRICFECFATMSIAVGYIKQQLRINLLYLLLVFIFGMCIPFFGLEMYLLMLSLSAIFISVFIYSSTFTRLEKDRLSI